MENEPVFFSEAVAKLDSRSVVGSRLRSRDWAEVPVALRERAFFSSGVENARVLQGMKDYLVDFLSEKRDAEGRLVAQGRAEFVADFREVAIREGLGKVGPDGRIDPRIDENDLTDLRSLARLQLVFDTQTEAANEYGFWKQGQDADLLEFFPAQRFIRVRGVRSPRARSERFEGVVRLKSDLDFWVNLNEDFGVPWGPWGFNSGMGVEDVDRFEAEDLGLLKPGDVVEPVERDFNARLGAQVRDLDNDVARKLSEAFGEAVEIRNGRAHWRGNRASAADAAAWARLPKDLEGVIREYTRSGEPGEWFRVVNGSLRAGVELDGEMAGRRDRLRRALALLPTHRGPVVRKTGELPAEALARYTPGARVRESFFVSSSLDEIPWERDATRWEIESATGHKIRQFSRKPWQNEVLFNVDREFEVVFNGVESGQRVIRLKEIVDENP